MLTLHMQLVLLLKLKFGQIFKFKFSQIFKDEKMKLFIIVKLELGKTQRFKGRLLKSHIYSADKVKTEPHLIQ